MVLRAIDWLLRKWASPWHAHMRAIDMAVLWPVCRNGAADMDQAKAAFAIHCFNDPAWLALGEQEILRRIDNLK
jgi:hypothetical protein